MSAAPFGASFDDFDDASAAAHASIASNGMPTSPLSPSSSAHASTAAGERGMLPSAASSSLASSLLARLVGEKAAAWVQEAWGVAAGGGSGRGRVGSVRNPKTAVPVSDPDEEAIDGEMD